jgi:hypothetical protein
MQDSTVAAVQEQLAQQGYYREKSTASSRGNSSRGRALSERPGLARDGKS